MKKSFILCLFIAITSIANAQLRKEITSERPAAKKTNSSDPLANFYGKALNFTLHKKGDTKIEHSVDQQVTLFKDGTLTTTVGVDYDKGTWTYDSASHLLTLTFTGDGENEDEVESYTIKEIQNTRIRLVDGDESLTLYILKKRSGSPAEF